VMRGAVIVRVAITASFDRPDAAGRRARAR
jgi:hypothetical protein